MSTVEKNVHYMTLNKQAAQFQKYRGKNFIINNGRSGTMWSPALLK